MVTEFGPRVAKAIERALAEVSNKFPMVLERRTDVSIECPKDGIEQRDTTLDISTLEHFIKVSVSIHIEEMPKLKEKKEKR